MALTVEFHTGVADDLAFTCRLLRKAYRQGARVQVRAPSARLARLDRELWTFAEREFIAHVRFAADDRPATAARAPIWLVDGEPLADGPPVLVNLGAPAPRQFDGLQRIIEVVGTDDAAADRGRERWRAYRAAGLPVKHHAASGAADG